VQDSVEAAGPLREEQSGLDAGGRQDIDITIGYKLDYVQQENALPRGFSCSAPDDIETAVCQIRYAAIGRSA
jgi:hypothetical protein